MHKPGPRAKYAYSHREKNDYPLQHALDYGDLVDHFCGAFAQKTLYGDHIGTKTRAGTAYLPKDAVDNICLHVFGESCTHFARLFPAYEYTQLNS